MAENHTVFTRFLKALEVPHTAEYSDNQFKQMTFQSLFGLVHLLKDYGIASDGWQLEDMSELDLITPPFLAQKKNGVFIIIKENDGQHDVMIDDEGKIRKIGRDAFEEMINGVVLTAYPDKNSTEPEYKSHSLSEIICKSSDYFLLIAAIAVAGWFIVTRGIFSHLSTALIFLLDLFGLWLSYMLLQKSLGIHTSTSERVCGVLEKGGCDIITTSSASKLFGVFSWSEVGFGYFGVSLITLLLFPHLWPALALCNICCLPYTLWSISYQKFVARHWCTLCVGVQATLWCLFFCYLGGGFVSHILPLHPDLIILVCAYIAAVIGLNRILAWVKKINN